MFYVVPCVFFSLFFTLMIFQDSLSLVFWSLCVLSAILFPSACHSNLFPIFSSLSCLHSSQPSSNPNPHQRFSHLLDCLSPECSLWFSLVSFLVCYPVCFLVLLIKLFWFVKSLCQSASLDRVLQKTQQLGMILT